MRSSMTAAVHPLAGLMKRSNLFVLEYDEIVSGAGMINKIRVDVYLEAPWEYASKDDQICVLHTLVISPRLSGKGLGTRSVRSFKWVII